MASSEACSACEAGGAPSPYVADGKVPAGRVMSVGGIETYSTWPGMSDGTLPQQTKLILFLTDIFGYSRPRAQTVADFIAAEVGALVVVPDLFFGKPWDHVNFPPSTDEEKAKFQEFLKTTCAVPPAMTHITEELLPALKTLSPPLKGFAAIGFCWGAAPMMDLAAFEPGNSLVIPYVGGAACHGSNVTEERASKVQVPVCLMQAENDPPVDPLRVCLSKSPGGANSLVEVFPGTFHGWMMRLDPSNAGLKASAERALSNCIAFLKARFE